MVFAADVAVVVVAADVADAVAVVAAVIVVGVVVADLTLSHCYNLALGMKRHNESTGR